MSPELRKAIADVVRIEVVPAVQAVIERALASRAGEAEFISVNQALRLLHVSRTQLYRLFAQGRLRPIKRGRTTLLHRDDVRQFVECLRQEASA